MLVESCAARSAWLAVGLTAGTGHGEANVALGRAATPPGAAPELVPRELAEVKLSPASRTPDAMNAPATSSATSASALAPATKGRHPTRRRVCGAGCGARGKGPPTHRGG